MKALKSGGKLVFEERKFKNYIAFDKYVEYLMTIGFDELYRGKIQCESGNEKENHLRDFIVMEKQ